VQPCARFCSRDLGPARARLPSAPASLCQAWLSAEAAAQMLCSLAVGRCSACAACMLGDQELALLDALSFGPAACRPAQPGPLQVPCAAGGHGAGAYSPRAACCCPMAELPYFVYDRHMPHRFAGPAGLSPALPFCRRMPPLLGPSASALGAPPGQARWYAACSLPRIEPGPCMGPPQLQAPARPGCQLRLLFACCAACAAAWRRAAQQTGQTLLLTSTSSHQRLNFPAAAARAPARQALQPQLAGLWCWGWQALSSALLPGRRGSIL
jgi:hypothetical protein